MSGLIDVDGQRIRVARNLAGLSQEELGENAGFSTKTIRQAEKNRAKREVVDCIAVALGLMQFGDAENPLIVRGEQARNDSQREEPDPSHLKEQVAEEILRDKQSSLWDEHEAETTQFHDLHTAYDELRRLAERFPNDRFWGAKSTSMSSKSILTYQCVVQEERLDEAADIFLRSFGRTKYLSVGSYPLYFELIKPLFGDDMSGLPKLDYKPFQSEFLKRLALVYSGLGRVTDAIEVGHRRIRLDIDDRRWQDVADGLLDVSKSLWLNDQRLESKATWNLAYQLAMSLDDKDIVTSAELLHLEFDLSTGAIDRAKSTLNDLANRAAPSLTDFKGRLSFLRCKQGFLSGSMSQAEWDEAANQCLDIHTLHELYALRAECDLISGNAISALGSAKEAVKLANGIGSPCPVYYDLQGWALAALNKEQEALANLDRGANRLIAAETCCVLKDTARAAKYATEAFEWALGSGPPNSFEPTLRRSASILNTLGEPCPATNDEPVRFTDLLRDQKEIEVAIKEIQTQRFRE